jgi:hypothetical protein
MRTSKAELVRASASVAVLHGTKIHCGIRRGRNRPPTRTREAATASTRTIQAEQQGTTLSIMKRTEKTVDCLLGAPVDSHGGLGYTRAKRLFVGARGFAGCHHCMSIRFGARNQDRP